MKTAKICFLIADGMGDWPLAELGERTPLAAAPTPNMDALARRGVMGLCRTVPHGMPPGSDIANMSLLGFDPALFHTGRGPIEAAAQGLDLDDGDLVWRLNLVTVSEFADHGLMRDYSAGHIASDAAARVIAELQDKLGDDVFSFHAGVQYRHLLVQKGGADSPEASLLVRPPHDITDQPMGPDFAAFAKSQRLNALVHAAAELLKTLDFAGKANSIWPWGQGSPLLLPDFAQTFGLKGAVVTAVDLVRGLGRAANMAVLDVPGVTGLLDTNYEGKVAAALEFLKEGDFVYLHVEAPDECGHAGNAADKVEAVRRFDERIVGPMVAGLDPAEAVFVVTCDHLTPIVERTHTSDPVPFLVALPTGGPNHQAQAFTEATAAEAELNLEAGIDLLPWLLEAVGRRA